MSQKKVDSYKEQKANRKQIIKKEKAILRLEKLLGVIVAIVIVCWVGFSVYGKVVEKEESVQTETLIDTTALDTYMSDLAAAEE